jgi:hypothetical protein
VRRARPTVVLLSFALVACGGFLGFSDDDGPPALVLDASSSTADADASDGSSVPPAVATCDGGPCERFVFITSAVYEGDLGGVEGANAKCMQRAAVGVPALAKRSFVALLSGTPGVTGDALERAPNGPPFHRVDGALVAQGTSLFNDGGTLLAPPNRDENGIERNDVAVWTGTNSFGQVTDQGTHCNDWTSAAAVDRGTTGSAHAAGILDGTWLYNNADACNVERRLYCVER